MHPPARSISCGCTGYATSRIQAAQPLVLNLAAPSALAHEQQLFSATTATLTSTVFIYLSVVFHPPDGRLRTCCTSVKVCPTNCCSCSGALCSRLQSTEQGMIMHVRCCFSRLDRRTVARGDDEDTLLNMCDKCLLAAACCCVLWYCDQHSPPLVSK
jgi:hypothetical protein